VALSEGPWQAASSLNGARLISCVAQTRCTSNTATIYQTVMLGRYPPPLAHITTTTIKGE